MVQLHSATRSPLSADKLHHFFMVVRKEETLWCVGFSSQSLWMLNYFGYPVRSNIRPLFINWLRSLESAVLSLLGIIDPFKNPLIAIDLEKPNKITLAPHFAYNLRSLLILLSFPNFSYLRGTFRSFTIFAGYLCSYLEFIFKLLYTLAYPRPM